MEAKPTVFVVDDDLAVLRALKTLIGAVFPDVATFSSASEFLEEYDSALPGCLLLDVAMPGINGLELQAKLGRENIDLPVVFITGRGNVRMAVDAMQAGAVDFLEKPFREQELLDSIRAALRRDTRNRRRQSERERLEQQVSTLSQGERRVFDLILQGKSNREMAAELEISIRTVEDRRARLMKKMRVKSVVELVKLATVPSD